MAQYFCLVGLHNIVGGAGVCLLGFEVLRYNVDIARILMNVPLPCHYLCTAQPFFSSVSRQTEPNRTEQQVQQKIPDFH
jgi:hypothetical protein